MSGPHSYFEMYKKSRGLNDKSRREESRFWRNDALEKAASIADRYDQPDVANDIRKMIDNGQ